MLRCRRTPATRHHLAEVVWSLERAVELFRRLVVVTHPAAVRLLRRITAVDIRLAAVVSRRAESPRATPPFQLRAHAASARFLGELLLPLVLGFGFVVRELHLVLGDFLIVNVRRVRALQVLQRLREDKCAMLVDVEHLDPVRQPRLLNLRLVREGDAVHGLLHLSLIHI